MLLAQPDLLPPIVVHRSPTFSLGTALAWLGHNCPGTCPAIACGCRASTWYIRLPPVPSPTWTRTLVEVDFDERPWTDDALTAMLGEVNRCVKLNHIRVRERSADARMRFLDALDARRAL